jgi:hypothetical protein
MDEELNAGSGFGGSNQRKLMIGRIVKILKDNLPKDRDKMVSKIEFETGLTKNKVREYVKLIKDNDYIKTDPEDERIIIWAKK